MKAFSLTPYVYMYIHKYVEAAATYICIYVNTDLCMYVFMYLWPYVYTYICIYV